MSRLRELRESQKFTQVKISMITGIDQSDYSKIETGKRSFTYEQCKRLAIALGTSMDYLSELTDVKAPYPKSEKLKKMQAASED